MLELLRKDLKKVADPKKAKVYQWFFKTGKGEYGYGDIFIGVTVPKLREIAKKYQDLSITEIKKLLASKIHEERLLALFILVNQYSRGKDNEKEKIYNFYLANTKFINNWDLVDSSAHKIVGEYLFKRPRDILIKLANSENLWEKRIAIITTAYFIKQKDFKYTFKIAEILLEDSHDLIHKAVGWMLREVGKISQKDEEEFLQNHYKKMPRTMLRYAIERFPENLRKKYLA